MRASSNAAPMASRSKYTEDSLSANGEGSGSQLLDRVILPNELIIEILEHLPTRQLILKMTPVCHFFQDIVQNLVHTRLLQFFPPKSFRINLKLFRPYEEEVPNRGFNFDDYRGTPGLEDISKCGSQGVNHEPSAERVALGSLYSRFESTGPDGQRAVAWEWMDLEQRAPFASFIMSFSFIKQLPGYDLVQWKQGKNTKLAREWLEQYSYYKDIVTGEWQRGGRKIEQGSINDDSDEAQNTIWMDESRNIGLRAKVIDKRARGRRGQMLSRASVHDVFSLDVEELVFRSTFLLLRYEAFSTLPIRASPPRPSPGRW